MKNPMIKPKVWDIQQIKELIHPINYRSTGRTTALIEAFIQLAKENPGLKIKLFDHYPHKNSMYDFINRVKGKIYVLNKEEFDKSSYLRYHIKEDHIFCEYTTDVIFGKEGEDFIASTKTT